MPIILGHISFLPSLNERPGQRIVRADCAYSLSFLLRNHVVLSQIGRKHSSFERPYNFLCKVGPPFHLENCNLRRFMKWVRIPPDSMHSQSYVYAQGGFSRGDNYHVKIFLWGFPNCKQRAANE